MILEFRGQYIELLTVSDGIAEITLESGGAPVANMPIYVFSAAGSYLGLTRTTDAAGQVRFRLPEGSYKFRADYQNSWTAHVWLRIDSGQSQVVQFPYA